MDKKGTKEQRIEFLLKVIKSEISVGDGDVKFCCLARIVEFMGWDSDKMNNKLTDVFRLYKLDDPKLKSDMIGWLEHLQEVIKDDILVYLEDACWHKLTDMFAREEKKFLDEKKNGWEV